MPAADFQLLSLDDLDGALARSTKGGLLLFKHSTRCPISAAAFAEFERFLSHRSGGRPSTALIRVIEERPVSIAAAQRLGVEHESPQAIWIVGQAAVASLSHGAITAESLAAMVGDTRAPG
jgi:bacillithiol system protein YtxJ